MPYTFRSFPKNLFGYVDFSELERYKKAWAKFEEIYAIQVLAREDKQTDGIYNINLPYQYNSFEEKNLVILGQQLHVKAFPPQSIDPFSVETETWSLQ
jgi:hypothetical protein